MVVTVIHTIAIEGTDENDIADEVTPEQCACDDVGVKSDEKTLIIDITNNVLASYCVDVSTDMSLNGGE